MAHWSRNVVFRIASLVVVGSLSLAKPVASQSEPAALIIVPSVGLADGLDRGVDVRLPLTPRLRLAASAYYWDGLEYICGSACPPQETGWSYGLGTRFEGRRSESRVWPFVQAEAGVHRFDGSLADSPTSEFFWSGRGGGATRLSERLQLELGLRLQRIPAYTYITESVRGRITARKSATEYFALTLGLAVFVF